MKEQHEIYKAIDHLFRLQSGKMVSVLCKLLGFENIETAQDIVQDTLLHAMKIWPFNGMPEQPEAWLYKVAKNKSIDYLRRNKIYKSILPYYLQNQHQEFANSGMDYNIFLDDEIEDSLLRMIFACCHPAIPEEGRLALVLKTLCGLNTQEIAKAFLTNEDTVNKRIYRAKEKIKNEKIELLMPSSKALPERLDNVLKCIYLLFNEGYNSSQTNNLIREDLCADAMRLCKMLVENKYTALPETFALLALMCFHSSRFASRIDNLGNIILLKHQDHSNWNYFLIKKGNEYLDKSSEGNVVSHWHLEAAIASIHATAKTFADTDWKKIHLLYSILYHINSSPVVALNKAISACYAFDYNTGLSELLQLKNLEKNHLYHAALGEVYYNLDKKDKARNYFENAISLTESVAEIQLLKDKINTLQD